MAEASKLRVTELDFDQIKDNFKSYLTSQEQFKDFDTTGSAMSVLMDLLAYNTHYNAFYLNMIANEMFIDTAVTRNSLMSLSKMLGYTPKSRRSATANVNLIITPTDNPSTVTIAKNTKFNSTINGVSFTYVTDKSYSVDAKGDNATLTVSGVQLKEGEPLTFRYTANTSDDTIKYRIPNRGVDTDSITVTLQESDINTKQYNYTLATDLITVNSTSNVFFIEPDADDTYQIKFGDDVFGRKETTGNIIILGYNLTSGSLGNGARTFSPISTVGGYSGATVTTIDASSGGSDEETNDSIRFNAPRHLEVQNRAVTTNDYKRLIEANFSQADSVIVYGGEDADPPEYGKVFIGIKPQEGLNISTSIKNEIKNDILRNYNIGSITPEFVDVDTLNLEFSLTVNYDSRLTSLTDSVIKQNILDEISDFSDSELEEFDKEFRISKFTSAIDSTNSAIVGTSVDMTLKKSFLPTLNLSADYTLKFNNQIFNPHTGYIGSVTSTQFTTNDGQDISRPGCFFDDEDGVMRIIRLENAKKIVVNANIGSVNYITGLITLKAFKPTAIVGNNIEVTVDPEINDVVPKREQIIDISQSDVTINMVDVASVKSGTRTFTSS